MPLRLNVGLTRKQGVANYGSRGASVNFEVELGANLVSQPDQLRGRIRHLFELAKDSVQEELNGHGLQEANGHQDNGQNGNGAQTQSVGRPATASQVRAIRAIASRCRIDLDTQLEKEFGVAKADDLLIGQASELIDLLKSRQNALGGQ